MSTPSVPQAIASGAARRILQGLKDSETLSFPLSGAEAQVVLGVTGNYLSSESSPTLNGHILKARKVLMTIFGGNAVIGPMSDKEVKLSKLQAMALCLILELYAKGDT